MPSHAFGSTVHAAPPPASGLKHSSGSIAAASLSILITAATAIRQGTQNAVILRSKTTEGSRTRGVWSRRPGHGGAGKTCRGRRSVGAAAHLSWLMLSYLCSRPPAKTRPTFSTTSVVVDIAVPMMEGAAVPLKTLV